MMTLGEAYRKIIDEWKAGKTKEYIAASMNVSQRYVSDTVARYSHDGDDIFNNKRPFKGSKNKIPDEAAIYANHRRNEFQAQNAAREMHTYRDNLKEGDRITIYRTEGQAFCRVDVAIEITVTYIGRDYVIGVTDRGVKESASFYDIWKWSKENVGSKRL